MQVCGHTRTLVVTEQELFQHIRYPTSATVGDGRNRGLPATNVQAKPLYITSLAAGSINAPSSIPSPSFLETSSTTTTASGSQTLPSPTGPASNLPSVRRIPHPNTASQGRNAVQMPPGAFVLLGVSKSYDLQLAHIDKRQHPNDDCFFKQLKRDYNQKRGTLRRCLGFYQFHHCEFVEVSP